MGLLMNRKQETMRTSHKVLVSLGVLSTIGAVAAVVMLRQNKPKSAQALMDQGQDLVNDTLTAVEASLKTTSKSLNKAVRSISSPDHTLKNNPKEDLS
jgi:uncharacterized membrane protein